MLIGQTTLPKLVSFNKVFSVRKHAFIFIIKD